MIKQKVIALSFLLLFLASPYSARATTRVFESKPYIDPIATPVFGHYEFERRVQLLFEYTAKIVYLARTKADFDELYQLALEAEDNGRALYLEMIKNTDGSWNILRMSYDPLPLIQKEE